MSNSLPYTDLSDDQLRVVHAVGEAFEQALRDAKPTSIEDQLATAGAEIRNPLLRELLAIELEWRMTRDGIPDIAEYHGRFPDHADDIELAFQEAARLDDSVRGLEAASDDTHAEAIGSMIGPYKLRELIGEGGMGLVYVAEQEKPVRRKVALKIIKPGLDTKEVIARFESERQALAMMDHPHIAHVLDVGVTDSGRPYFVMELIRGAPVTEHCNTHKLSTRARLELFVQICQAVQHAHQKGIIHRDIKPTNILITLRGDVAVPKVIDFGVAKAINQRLTERTIYTQMSQLVGTPMYMSPEQAQRSAEEVDIRTDIFSLGVVLYELLTGTTPFTKERLSQVGYDELRRIIREEDPPRPSYRLSTLAAEAESTISDQRSAGPLKLFQILRGELDWIVLKAMEKDFTRRYETARDFAADIQHYLADEPVLACPPSTGYRLRKFARRNKVALAAASLVMAGLLAGIAGLAVSNAMIAQQRNAAEAQREIAEENFRFARDAVDRYFTLASEDALLNESLRKGLIDNAVQFYELLAARRGNDPEVLIAAANTRLRLAAMHHRLGNMEEALAVFEKALDMIEDLLTRMPVSSEEFRSLPGYYHYWAQPDIRDTRSVTDRERAAFQRAVALWHEFADAHPDVAAFRRDLAFFLPFEGRYFGTRELIETLRSVQRLQEELVEQHPENGELLAELASTIWRIGYITEDPLVMRDGISNAIEADLDRREHRALLAMFLRQLGWELMEHGQHAEAAEALQKSIVIYRVLAREFPDVVLYAQKARSITSDLARALLNSGQQSEAKQLALELSPRTGNDFLWRGHIYRELRQEDNSIADYEKALEVGLNGYTSSEQIRRAGRLLDRAGKHEQAILFYNHVMAYPDGAVCRTYAQRGASWAHLKQYDKALADFTNSIESGANGCEYALSRMSPSMLQESPADFQAKFLQLADRVVETEGSGQSYIARSLVYFNLGQRDKAREDLSRGVELDPDFKVRDYLRPLLKEL